MNTLRRLSLLLLLSCTFSLARAANEPAPTLEPLSNFPQSTLTIITPNGRQHLFNVWIADTDAHREQGLMMVKALAPNTGMLFIFDQPERIQMWMKNTLIPLDMLFIDAEGRVDSIAANTTPMSLNIIDAKRPVSAVLEIAGGSAAKAGINAGAVVKLSFFEKKRGDR
jgi:hypothetical protein